MFRFRFWEISVIAFFVIAIFLLNFKTDTFLTGWDNLHPEFNFGINIKRSVFAVWQEYQGLGLLGGGMGHASDLIHQVFLFLLSFILPIDLLRYFWTFLMLFIGPLGTYYLIRFICRSELVTLESNRRIPESDKLVPLIGSLFYLLNLSAVQTFYAPFEAFIAHYASLPWLLLFSIAIWQNPSKKNFLYFALVLFLAAPAWYVPTLFVVYIISFTLLILGLSYASPLNTYNRNFLKISQNYIKNGFKTYALIIAVNAFWLIPSIYFTVTNSSVTLNAKINQMATENVFLQNKEYGGIQDVMLLKGFWFNNVDPDKSGKFSYMMKPWRNYFSSPVPNIIGYVIFSIVILGIFFSLKSKNPVKIAFLILFLFSFTMLATNTLPFSFIDAFFRKIPILNQAFRFPFTKFSILASLTYAVFFAFGIGKLLQKLKKQVFILVPVVFLIIYVFPVFNGNLFYEKEKLLIPKDYFNLFDFFKKQDQNARIANFPQPIFWGWTFYKWGYGGSGFLWHGINQPIIDRAFDVWSKENENYYHEISYAIYSKNKELFRKIIDKYQVKYIVIDENVFNPTKNKEHLYLNELKDMVRSIDTISPTTTFGKISIYTVKNQAKDYIFLTEDLSPVGPDYIWNNFDGAFFDNRDYVSYNNLKQNPESLVYYPFRSIFTGKKQEEIEFEIKENKDSFSFYSKIPKDMSGSNLIIPPIYAEEVMEWDKDNFNKVLLKQPQIFLDDEIIIAKTNIIEQNLYQKENNNSLIDNENENTKIYLPYIKEGNLEIRVPKIKGVNSYDSDENNDLLSRTPKTCDLFNNGLYAHEKLEENNKTYLRLTSIDSSNCLNFDLPNFSQRTGYLANVETRHNEGKELLFAITNNNSFKPVIETYLSNNKDFKTEYFIVPPMENYGLGYNLYFDNISIGKSKTINDLRTVRVNPIPYKFLTSIKIIKGNPKEGSILPSDSISVEHPNPSLYRVNFNNLTIQQFNSSTTLVLSQSFDKGWKAYQVKSSKLKVQSFLAELFPFLFGSELKEHVLVNNWENGWLLDDSTIKQYNNSTIILVYLPQYLQYLGFALLFSTFFLLLFWFLRHKSVLR